MSAETLTRQFESEPDLSQPLQGPELLNEYAQQVEELLSPLDCEITDDYTSADLILPASASSDGRLLDTSRVKDTYAENAAKTAYDSSWWRQTLSSLKENYASDPDLVDEVQLTAKHNFNIKADGKPTKQGFEVYEIGEPAENQEILDALHDSLTAIDQFSGGLMASDANRPKIVLANGIRFVSNHHGQETFGYARPEVVVVNVSAVKDEAEHTGADLHDLMATIVTHELLGHGMERVTKGPGEYYNEHFDYSEDLEAGEQFTEVHASITPKSDEYIGSQPVREYGRRSPDEDLATSVDATVAEAMGWAPGVQILPRFKSTPDAHRSDLAIQLMQDAADKAAADVTYLPDNRNKPGIVGSEIVPIKNDQNEIIGFEPVRQLELTTVSGRQAMKDDIAKEVASRMPSGKLKVYIREADINSLL